MSPSGGVALRGDWPGLVTLRSGWWKGVARPVHDDSPDAVLRVERASGEFVRRAAETLVDDLGAPEVISPPLMRGSDRVFRAGGFRPHTELLLLERDLRLPVPRSEGIRTGGDADLEIAVRIDDAAFSEEWRVGRLGLRDALTAAADTVMLLSDDDAGFSVVGVSAEIGYLQRIAVRPDRQGAGRGRRLLVASMSWARSRGARTMLLNTQTDNRRATEMYRSESFQILPGRLTIHRFVR